jgi:flagella basal body P-ring formation protein FlgA
MKCWATGICAIVLGLLGPGAACADTMALPVPTRTIFPGQQIQDADFTQKDFEVSDTARQNFVINFDQIQNKQATKLLPVGKAVPLASLAKANDVRKGKETIAHFVADGIDIQGVLSPLKDGIAGETIPCRNPSSGLTVDALVLADGSLSVSEK